MKAVIQRVSRARVVVAGEEVGGVNEGLLVLLGVHTRDTEDDGKWLAQKIAHLRIFNDQRGNLNLSLLDIGGEMLIVSQFTLLADCRKGRRPSWNESAPPEKALQLYNDFINRVKALNIPTATGQFQASMEVSLVNDGPVTIILDSHQDR
ncbi:MAG: D-aminoacyl-tRNA deacylase [Desulfobulbaceae bacterium]|nr:D-aminoacyl-tRNA deacylase [Desulfobulbaceae bacterium]